MWFALGFIFVLVIVFVGWVVVSIFRLILAIAFPIAQYLYFRMVDALMTSGMSVMAARAIISLATLAAIVVVIAIAL